MTPPAAPGACRTFTTVLVDLDDCMYRVEEMPELVREKIQEYMEHKLGIPHADIPDFCLECYTNFGTTMAGLVARGYQIDADDWHAHVHHTLPYQQLLSRDEQLRAVLQGIQVPCYVFTNADRKHAEICLEILGVRDCFKGLICYESIMDAAQQRGYIHNGIPIVCKPTNKAIELALQQAGGAQAEQTLYLDDSTRNVAAGHQAGMFSILVGRTGVDSAADAQISSIYELPCIAPQLYGDHLPPALAAPAAGSEMNGHAAVMQRAAGVTAGEAAAASGRHVPCHAHAVRYGVGSPRQHHSHAGSTVRSQPGGVCHVCRDGEQEQQQRHSTGVQHTVQGDRRTRTDCQSDGADASVPERPYAQCKA